MALVSALVLPMAPVAQAAQKRDVRVGLYYGNNGLPSANLQNYTGSGYRFGYYDSSNKFITLGSTSEKRITMCKDANLYLSNGVFHEEAPATSYRLVGAYHLQVNKTYNSYNEAKNAAASYPYGFPAYINGKFVVRFEFYSTKGNAQADAGRFSNVSVVGGSTTCYTVVNTATGDILFEFDQGDLTGLAVSPDTTGVAEPITWFKGYRYYGNFQYIRRYGNDLTVINVVDSDRYVEGVLPYEFVASGGLESLKAGAVAIRTFAMGSTKHKSLGFDVCNSTDCQVYHGAYFGAEREKIHQAAQSTSGQCLYYNGALIEATFYAANGGATETAGNTWAMDFPYLVAQKDPYEGLIAFNSKQWYYVVTPEQVRQMLLRAGYSCGEIVSMEVTELTSVGNVNEVQITDSSGRVFTYNKDGVRKLSNIEGITYFSRRFRILPVYNGVLPEMPPINDPSDYSSDGEIITPTEPTPPTYAQGMTGPVTVLDGETMTERESMYVLTANGVSHVKEPVTVLTDSGVYKVNPEASTASTQETPVLRSAARNGGLTGWVIYGCGYGHNVGLSQWGAYAMASLDHTYEEILAFYYPGTKLN